MNKFLKLSADELEEIKSSFLISYFSQSGVSNFQRNELNFAKSYIYGERSNLQGVSAVTGTAYDKALQEFFFEWKTSGKELPLEEMLDVGITEIMKVEAKHWKQGKTYKPIETLQNEAVKYTTLLINSFLKESNSYLKDIQEIVSIDEKKEAYVVLNGVDIPFPLVFVPDLVYINKAGELCVLDHKSVGKYITEQEITFHYANQATAYAVGVNALIEAGEYDEWLKKYPKVKEGVKNFKFFENKRTKNTRGALAGMKQIQEVKIPLTPENMKLYEAIFYEPVKRMIEAVSNPDYVYLINPNDNWLNEEQKAELMQFWIRLQIAEVEEFSLDESKKNLLKKRTKKIRDSSIQNIRPEVIEKFKNDANKFITYSSMENKTPAEKIKLRLQTLGVLVEVAHEEVGYSCDTYLLEISAGIKLSKVLTYSLDIANALGVSDVIISNELRIWKGKSYVEVQVPKTERRFLKFPGGSGLSLELGLDNFGNRLVWDLENPSTPHGIICGATGSGKSVCLNTIINSIQGHYDELYIFDPKYEFPGSINDIEEIDTKILELVFKMEELVKSRQKRRVIIIFDELADALTQSKARGGMIAKNIQLLLQKGRSVGFNVIAATQRASAKVLSGDALVNFPVRIAFRTPKQIDSQVILGEPGAEKLLGKGDGLFLSGEVPAPVRFQGYI